MRILFLLVTLILTSDGSPLLGENVPLGVWSWSQEDLMTESARTRMLNFCRDQGITQIDQHVSIRPGSDGPSIQNASQLTSLIVQASKQGISVSGLRGDRKMFFADQHDERISELKALIQFNRNLPSGVSLEGIKYDVEPYLTDQWKEGGQRREQVMHDYLQCLTEMRRYLSLNNSKLQLSVDVPFWWDEDEHALQYDGVRKTFTQHIQDRTDSISIMSYRRSAKDVLRLAEQEFRYARNRPRSVAIGLSFNPELGEESVTTFHGHSVSLFRETLQDLKTALNGNSAARIIMLHDYKHLANYLSQNESH